MFPYPDVQMLCTGFSLQEVYHMGVVWAEWGKVIGCLGMNDEAKGIGG